MKKQSSYLPPIRTKFENGSPALLDEEELKKEILGTTNFKKAVPSLWISAQALASNVSLLKWS